MMYRVETHGDEWIDRSGVLRFTFEGREYQGYPGDTISSALAAAGVAFMARSFKYHRPRTILSFANHDSNTLFQVDGERHSASRGHAGVGPQYLWRASP